MSQLVRMAKGYMVGCAPLEEQFASGNVDFLEEAVVDPALSVKSYIRAINLFILVYCEKRSSVLRDFELVEIASHVNVNWIYGMGDFVGVIKLQTVSLVNLQARQMPYQIVRAIRMWSMTCTRPEGQEVFPFVPLHLQVHCLSKLPLGPDQIPPRIQNYRPWIRNIDTSRAQQNELASVVASRIPLRYLRPRRWLAKRDIVLRRINPIEAKIVRVEGPRSNCCRKSCQKGKGGPHRWIESTNARRRLSKNKERTEEEDLPNER